MVGFVEHHVGPFCCPPFRRVFHATSGSPICSLLYLFLSLPTLEIADFLQDPLPQIVLSHSLLCMCAGAELTISAEWLVSILS